MPTCDVDQWMNRIGQIMKSDDKPTRANCLATEMTIRELLMMQLANAHISKEGTFYFHPPKYAELADKMIAEYDKHASENQ